MLNQIAETLNEAVDVRTVLNGALARLVDLMGLRTGWIFLKQPAAQDAWHGRGYVLAAHDNLPPALALDSVHAWGSGCDCQGLCNKGKLTEAYNEVRCSRLAESRGDRRGLTVHASVPLRCCDDVLGILNVAAENWSSFSPEALALLTNVGSMMGIALQRAQLFDLLKERRIHEQAALLDFSSQLLGRLDLDDLSHYVVEQVRQLVQADAVALLLAAEEPGYLVLRAASGWLVDPSPAQHRVPADFGSAPGRVVQTQQPSNVADLALADGVDGLPGWLSSEGFHGHALIPLIADGRSIGALMINMRTPRLLDEDEVRFLRLIGNQAALALEKARLHQEALRRQRLEHELDVARQIQLSLLPKTLPNLPGWEFAAVYRAARQVGGDFYDFIDGSSNECEGSLGVVIADVADKGMPAALFMALARTIIRNIAMSGCSPAAVLVRANQLILKDTGDDNFLTAFYAMLDAHTGQLTYACAGHNRPLWRQAATGALRELEAPGTVLGMFGYVALEDRSICVAPGDLLVFYTDGVTDATNSQEQFFGVERLRDLVQAQSDASAQQVAQAITSALESFTGAAIQHDDFTFVVVKRSSEF
ncbi:MAG: SpoIIE family protein phosphatase [Chloroflexi bacterium]|nr:SpoIIE family protein phosphatase [Chloroflexota bacterium]